MWKFIRPFLFSSVVLVPVAIASIAPSSAQERQGCFMVNQRGTLIDLDELCPVATPFTPPAPQAAAGEPQLGTGDIQVTLRWTSVDDLDLAVIDPSGDIVAYFSPSIPSGGQLDVDANAACSEGNTSPIENIFWPTGEAPQGEYTIEVNLFTRCAPSSEPIPFSLRVLSQGTVNNYEGTVSDASPTETFPLSMPPQ